MAGQGATAVTVAGQLPVPVTGAGVAVTGGTAYLVGGNNGVRPVPAVTRIQLTPDPPPGQSASTQMPSTQPASTQPGQHTASQHTAGQHTAGRYTMARAAAERQPPGARLGPGGAAR